MDRLSSKQRAALVVFCAQGAALVCNAPFAAPVTAPPSADKASDTSDRPDQKIDRVEPHTGVQQGCEDLAQDKEKAVTWIDQTHADMSARLCNQVNTIDGFFGKVNPDKNAIGFMRIRFGYQWEQTDENSTEFQPSIKTRIRLPNISKHLSLLITDDENDDNTIPLSKQSAQQDLSDGPSTLGKLLGVNRSDPVDYDIDIGSKSDDGPKIFTRARATWQLWPSDNSYLRLSQAIFWLDGLGYGEESRLEYNQNLDETTLFRWTTATEFSEETDGLAIEQSLVFFKQIDAKRGLSYDIHMSGATRPTLKVTDYGLRILYRRNFMKPWLFFEMEPSIFWPLEYDRDMSVRLIFRFEVQLGNQEGGYR